MRKVIQMTATQIREGERYWSMLYTALCDDGTMWQGDGCWNHNDWKQIVPIPQDGSKTD